MDENGAVVQILALATRANEFRDVVRNALDELGFDLVALDDSEPLVDRRQQWTVDETLLAKAAEVRATGHARFGSFFTWLSDD
jgi:hypothetical protein